MFEKWNHSCFYVRRLESRPDFFLDVKFEKTPHCKGIEVCGARDTMQATLTLVLETGDGFELFLCDPVAHQNKA